VGLPDTVIIVDAAALPVQEGPPTSAETGNDANLSVCSDPSSETATYSHAAEATIAKIPPSSLHASPSSSRPPGLHAQQPLAPTWQTRADNRDRGGSAQRTTSGGPSEGIELVEYPTAEQKYRDAVRERERKYDAKRAAKRRWLEQQDEMKFSHSIQFNAVPDWSNHYIAYSNLKKLYGAFFVTCSDTPS